MERLPYIDDHEVEVPADADAAWRALLQVAHRSFGETASTRFGRALRLQPPAASGDWAPGLRPGVALAGFAVERVRPAELLSLRGSHRFSRYRLDFELEPTGTGRCRLRARSWGEFPGLAGAAYRALVIGSGGHGLVVRRMLRRVADTA